jgi:hypothetical protein
MKGCCLDPRHGKNMDIRKANETMAKDVFSKPDVLKTCEKSVAQKAHA